MIVAMPTNGIALTVVALRKFGTYNVNTALLGDMNRRKQSHWSMGSLSGTIVRRLVATTTKPEDANMQLRRAFGTIHEGHCTAGWDISNLYLFLKTHLSRDDYTAGAFALEETSEGNLHIQFYIECKIPKRPSTMASDFIVSTEAVFDVVRDAKGAWEYCTGTGERHGEKPAFERFEFGTPILYGGTARADLKELVDLVISGADLQEIMKGHPYSYCVHRTRIVSFFNDWHYGNMIFRTD